MDHESKKEDGHKTKIEDEYIVWKGHWESVTDDRYSGTIELPLKKGLRNYDQNMKSYYTKGAINIRDTIKTLDIHVDPTTISKLKDGVIRNLCMNGYIDSNKVIYNITIKNNTIIGVYKIENLEEVGTIKLFPTGNTYIDYGATPKGWCVIF